MLPRSMATRSQKSSRVCSYDECYRVRSGWHAGVVGEGEGAILRHRRQRRRNARATGPPWINVPTSERDDLQEEVDRVDSEIDGLVYELYGLTEGERRLVEEGR